MRIFLDTEFTDLLNPVLISLGLVADSEEEFYAEVPFPDHACTPFVREVVVPLLRQYPHAFCTLDELGPRIIKWLNIVRRKDEEIEICVDYPAGEKVIAADYCDTLHGDIAAIVRST